MAYTIRNSMGNVVATIAPNTTSGSSFPIVIPGSGVSPYGEIIGEDLYHLMENFANSVPPTNPVPGMLWFSTSGKMYFYDGTNWVLLGGTGGSSSGQLPQAPTATSVDFTTSSSVVLTNNTSSLVFHPTLLFIEPAGPITATGNAMFNLSVVNPEDVLENSVIELQDNHFSTYTIQGKTRMVRPGESLSINIVTPMSGSGGMANVIVYGITK